MAISPFSWLFSCCQRREKELETDPAREARYVIVLGRALTGLRLGKISLARIEVGMALAQKPGDPLALALQDRIQQTDIKMCRMRQAFVGGDYTSTRAQCEELLESFPLNKTARVLLETSKKLKRD